MSKRGRDHDGTETGMTTAGTGLVTPGSSAKQIRTYVPSLLSVQTPMNNSCWRFQQTSAASADSYNYSSVSSNSSVSDSSSSDEGIGCGGFFSGLAAPFSSSSSSPAPVRSEDPLGTADRNRNRAGRSAGKPLLSVKKRPNTVEANDRNKPQGKGKAGSDPTADVSDADDLLVKELNSLTLEERQRAYEDIHGIDDVFVEDPTLLQAKLDEFDTAVKKLLASRTSSVTVLTQVKQTSKNGKPLKSKQKNVTYSIDKELRVAYELANFYSPRFANDRGLRLMFIRCEDYDIGPAVIRYIRFFNFKQSVFGTDKLVKRITLDDVEQINYRNMSAPVSPTRQFGTENDDNGDSNEDGDIYQYEGAPQDNIPFIHRGYMQVLPHPDRSGRSIILYFNKLCKYRHVSDVTSNYYYVIMQHLMHNTERQIRGIVGIGYEAIKVDGADTYMLDGRVTNAHQQIFAAMPLKFKALHFCYDDYRVYSLMSMVKFIMDKRGRVRFRQHWGSDQECRYHLMTFGIPSTTFPIDHDSGRVKMDMYFNWLEECRERERRLQAEEDAQRQRFIESNQEGIDEWVDAPTSKDILLGKGKPFQEHIGNKRLHSLVSEHWDDYVNFDRSERSMMFDRLVQELRDSGIRFLVKRGIKFNDSGSVDGKSVASSVAGTEILGDHGPEWKRVNDAKAREKISHAFRNKPIVARYHSEKHKDQGKS